MKKVMIVFGTRPEAIKMCPVVQELRKRPEFETIVCVTGQHEQMLKQVLDCFHIVPKYNLSIMKDRQTLFDVTTNILLNIKEVLTKENPDMILVHGDTTTTFATALSAFYLKIPVGHVEAGLRTHNLYSPYPEEFNRQATGIITLLHFAPTLQAKENLLQEGKDASSIYVTGNTAIDALQTTVISAYHHELLDWIGQARLLLLTAHRRENIGIPLHQMFTAIKRIVDDYPDVKVIYPVHMNPVVRQTANAVFQNHDRIRLTEPLSVIDFHNLMAHAYLVLTDSGGIQEEAPSLGKPVLVMRDTTERPEGVMAGTLKLVGTNTDTIYAECKLLLDDQHAYDQMSKTSNPYGDGQASVRIADALTAYFRQ